MRATLVLASFAGLALAFPQPKACPVADISILAHEGTPIGKEQVFDGCEFVYIPLNEMVRNLTGKK